MAKEAFIEKDFSAGSLKIIGHANEIIEAYQAQGFTLTLRQLYYQFVSRNLIANKQSEYKRLGGIINNARLAGLVDWNAIEDRTRNLKNAHDGYLSPSSAVQDIARGYFENVWDDQPRRVEVWIEKDALVGVIERVCYEFRVPFFACRGYSSQSEQYTAGERFAGYVTAGLKPVTLHLGDHDPSGIDMTRDNQDRVSMFAGEDIEVRRLALNHDQIERFNPPPNPLKTKADGDLSDSRGKAYADEFGESSWELDALEPRVIADLIRSEIEDLVDPYLWQQAIEKEKANKEGLAEVAGRWGEIVDYLKDTGE